MRTVRRNSRHLYYATLKGSEPEFVYDSSGNKVIDKVGSDGTIYYKKTGRKTLVYNDPQGFFGNIAFSGSEVNVAEYGVDVSNYDAILIMPEGSLPITETSLLWLEHEPTYKDSDKTIVDGNKADFKVLQVKKSLNYVKYILGRLQGNE